MAGRTIEFPIELASGGWIEGNGPDDCAVYGAKGEPLGKVIPQGDWPVLSVGANALQFSCEPGNGPPPRGRIVTITNGEEL